MEQLNYCYKYPRPAVTTDCVIFGKEGEELSILLIQRKNDPFKGCWAFPGGFLNMDENAETGAKRELKEETGLDVKEIKQLGAFSDVDRDPRGRVITIAYYTIIAKENVKAADDAAKAQWFPIRNLPSLAFDHDKILQKALEVINVCQ